MYNKKEVNKILKDIKYPPKLPLFKIIKYWIYSYNIEILIVLVGVLYIINIILENINN